MIEGQIGNGAFGTVFLARHIILNVFRAIKCISLCQDTYDTAYREADILKNLRHPAVPIIYDILQDGGYIYIVEEYVDGMSLNELISIKKLHTQECFNIALQLCSVISYLHDNGVYHLDIKPENIIVNSDGIRVIDYGSAVHAGTDIDVRMGTRGYASPEMYGREAIGAGSDVYSVGIVILFMLTGSKEESAFISLRNTKEGMIIGQCIAHNSRERIGSVKELADLLNSNLAKGFADKVSVNIHIGGIGRHCGCTHCAISAGRIFTRRGFSTLVCENNDSGDVFELVRAYDFSFHKGIFTLRNLNIIPNYHEYLDMGFVSGFTRVIKDFGCITDDNLEEFLSGDAIWLVVGGQPYEISGVEKVLFTIPNEQLKKCRTLVNYTSPSGFKSVCRRLRIPNPVRVPYEPDVFNSRKDWL